MGPDKTSTAPINPPHAPRTYTSIGADVNVKVRDEGFMTLVAVAATPVAVPFLTTVATPPSPPRRHRFNHEKTQQLSPSRLPHVPP